MARKESRTATETNVDSFSTDDMVERYADRRGLYEKEEMAVSQYFGEDGGRVLDVGCGTGRTTAPLAERGFDVVGIDISERMIERARTLLPDVEFQVGDVTDLSFDDDEFDYALFAHNGLDYVHPARERRKALRELRRVVRPGGVVVFSTHNAWYRFPALLADHSFLRTFYLDNGNLRRLFRRYKVDTKEGDPLWTYVSDPRKQRRQLERAGLEPVELVSQRDGVGKFFEAMLYYVAESQ